MMARASGMKASVLYVSPYQPIRQSRFDEQRGKLRSVGPRNISSVRRAIAASSATVARPLCALRYAATSAYRYPPRRYCRYVWKESPAGEKLR